MTIYSLDVLLSQFRTSLLFQSSSNCCFLTCIQVSEEAGPVVWYAHLLKYFPKFIVIHTVKGFGVVNKAQIDVYARAAIIRYHKLGCMSSMNLLIHSPHDLKFKIKVLAVLLPSEGCKSSVCLLAFGGLLAVFCIPWLVVSAFILSVCLCVSKFCCFIRTPVILY